MKSANLKKAALGVLLVWAFMAGFALVESFGFFAKNPEEKNLAFENALVSLGEGKTPDSTGHTVFFLKGVLSSSFPDALPQILARPLVAHIVLVLSRLPSSPSGSLFVLRI